MAVSFTDNVADCPFYNRITGNQIYCEGFVDRAHTAMVFNTKAYRQEWLMNVCGGNYELCPMYWMINKEKYKNK